MKMLLIGTFLLVRLVAGEQNRYYAGKDNALVQLGAQRVLNLITYPAWFQYPNIPPAVRQQLVDNYTTRAFLLAFDKGDETTPARWTALIQTVVDVLGSTAATNQIVPYPSTKEEANSIVRNNLIPQLVKPRDDYEKDSPSDNETADKAKLADYRGQNGDDIRLLDQETAYLAKHHNIPITYSPAPSSDDLSKLDYTKMSRAQYNKLDAQLRSASQAATAAYLACFKGNLGCETKCEQIRNIADMAGCVGACDHVCDAQLKASDAAEKTYYANMDAYNKAHK